MNLHNVEINFVEIGKPGFSIKVDGKEIRNTCGIVIKSPLARRDKPGVYVEPIPIVEISFYANITGKVEGEIIEQK